MKQDLMLNQENKQCLSSALTDAHRTLQETKLLTTLQLADSQEQLKEVTEELRELRESIRERERIRERVQLGQLEQLEQWGESAIHVIEKTRGVQEMHGVQGVQGVHGVHGVQAIEATQMKETITFLTTELDVLRKDVMRYKDRNGLGGIGSIGGRVIYDNVHGRGKEEKKNRAIHDATEVVQGLQR
jgi:hypothetical protein